MSNVPRIIFVSIFAPTGDGHGGNHRTYQIWHDCRRAFGEENVRALSFETWQREYAAAGGSAGQAWRRRQSLRFRRLAGLVRDSMFNPARVAGSFRWAMSFHHPAFLAAYRAMAADMGGGVICLLEDPRFVSILQHNRRAGIPCLLAPQNIQSFHDVAWPTASAWRNRVRVGNFLHEFRAYEMAARTLLISKVEAGAVGGIGLPAAYYPYRPTGEIAAYCDEIRARRFARQEANENSGKITLLFVGSAGHPPTIASVNWLLDGVTREPLPGHIELLLVGGGTDRLAAARQLPANVSALGRVSNDRLKELLIDARGVLIPAFQGMGAVTRISEMHRAGVPLLVSSHAMHAVDPLPDITTLEECWPDWVAAIHALAARPRSFETTAPDEGFHLDQLRRWAREAAGASPRPQG